ncbi:MAG: tRNA (adenosine(37)-N6)-threonylcarbamoyltransferase complex ATPase subunit type 1 TsaE [Ignavibacteriae bacterium HGW-Ignavibacteriae-3]|nr:MAG: tRNA (adenosine(37)-N6)-threonylcarbamoyltransferase complex ATPase subunit type 1 TsaE [Ignavibacteriae bacterium HGW-Ignavibacteriae-3]
MVFPFHKIVNSEAETSLVAKEFSEILSPGKIVLLNGDLGTGKTFFVKNVCAQFGIVNVSSPSFSIVNEYHNGKKIIHFDFYRIKKYEELYDIGIDDYLMNKEAVIFIEWPDLFPDIIPNNYFKIDFKFVNNSSREITILRHE